MDNEQAQAGERPVGRLWQRFTRWLLPPTTPAPNRADILRSQAEYAELVEEGESRRRLYELHGGVLSAILRDGEVDETPEVQAHLAYMDALILHILGLKKHSLN